MSEETKKQGCESKLGVPAELQGKSLSSPKTVDVTTDQAEDTPTNYAEKKPSEENKLSFAQHTHLYIRDYIKLADTKAAFTFTIGAGLLAYLFEKEVAKSWLKAVSEWSLIDLIAFLAMFGLAISCILAIAVVFPRVKGSRRGHIFWSGIAEFGSPVEYVDSTTRLTEANVTSETLKHCYELSIICRSKYNILNYALIVGSVGAISTIVFLLFG